LSLAWLKKLDVHFRGAGERARMTSRAQAHACPRTANASDSMQRDVRPRFMPRRSMRHPRAMAQEPTITLSGDGARPLARRAGRRRHNRFAPYCKSESSPSASIAPGAPCPGPDGAGGRRFGRHHAGAPVRDRWGFFGAMQGRAPARHVGGIASAHARRPLRFEAAGRLRPRGVGRARTDAGRRPPPGATRTSSRPPGWGPRSRPRPLRRCRR
jgi:hypothetical protein